LYIVVRSDLSPGLQAAQAVHAAFAFGHRHSNLVGQWITESNFLVIVAVPDEDSLRAFAEEAFTRNIVKVNVTEPDLDNELTAVALAPGNAAKKLCANLPLAMKQVVMV
jgi:peptidyl-tRNA hydrolase